MNRNTDTKMGPETDIDMDTDMNVDTDMVMVTDLVTDGKDKDTDIAKASIDILTHMCTYLQEKMLISDVGISPVLE